MFIELECYHCGRKQTTNFHGPTALEDIEKYDTKRYGKPHILTCFCGHPLHKIGSQNEDPILKRKTPNQILSDK